MGRYRCFPGLTTEYYDIFYSNSGGTFNIDGEFITIMNQRPGVGEGNNATATQMGWGLNGETSRLTFGFDTTGSGGGSSSPAPEPAPMGVLGLGLGTIALIPRRKEAH